VRTMNRLPRKLDAQSPVQSKSEESHDMRDAKRMRHGGPGPTHNSNRRLANHRMPKGANSFHTLSLDPNLHEDGLSPYQPEASIPAIFPYEGKAAIMAELNRLADSQPAAVPDDAKVDHIAAKIKMDARELVDAPSQDVPFDIESIANEHIDNTVEGDLVHFKKSSKEARNMDEHFFYNNPIVEFKLPDGTVGSIVKTPRK